MSSCSAKCAFLLLSVFLRQFGASPQVVAASIVLFVATSVHLQHRPYADPKHNTIESIGLHACQLQLLVALMSNMIGRRRSVSQSAIGPVSTVVVVIFTFFSTGHYFYMVVMYTMQNSQMERGIVGNIARCCGRCAPNHCGAQSDPERTREHPQSIDIAEESILAHGKELERQSQHVIRAGTIRGSLRYNVGVALQYKKGMENSHHHEITRAALQKQVDANRRASHIRLEQRLKKLEIRANAERMQKSMRISDSWDACKNGISPGPNARNASGSQS